MTDEQHRIIYDTIRDSLGTLAMDPRLSDIAPDLFFLSAFSTLLSCATDCKIDGRKAMMSLLLTGADRAATLGDFTAAVVRLNTNAAQKKD